MRDMKLYRGIAVSLEESPRAIANIQANGISGSEGTWNFQLPEIAAVRERLDELFGRSNLTRDDIFSHTPFIGVCACGQAAGAEYYALRHNFTAKDDNQSLEMEFTASVDDVYVDGRDFLCTAMQLWDRESSTRQDWQANIMCELFGPAIARYFAAACKSPDQGYRIAVSNLAALDPSVVMAHANNRKVIAGRHGTRFSSAFFVKAPIPASKIIDVYPPLVGEEAIPDITLDECINGRTTR